MSSSFVTQRTAKLKTDEALVNLNKSVTDWSNLTMSTFTGYLTLTKRTLGECLLISSLPGKASRTFVDIARLAELFNMRSKPSLVNLISKDADLGPELQCLLKVKVDLN